jgi:hypothetical protein
MCCFLLIVEIFLLNFINLGHFLHLIIELFIFLNLMLMNEVN